MILDEKQLSQNSTTHIMRLLAGQAINRFMALTTGVVSSFFLQRAVTAALDAKQQKTTSDNPLATMPINPVFAAIAEACNRLPSALANKVVPITRAPSFAQKRGVTPYGGATPGAAPGYDADPTPQLRPPTFTPPNLRR